MTANLKTEEIPAGGIADFVMTDEQIEQLEAEELKEQFGTNGIAQFSDVGKKMANFGRYGDDTVAHVETGELIVPRALIENNPALKESIFNHLRELGVEDPERYVVGEVKNSVNPTTGLPEFFFKKLIKSVSKIAKGVGKALKKAAPIILPIALAMTPLGPIYGAALGSGIGTLVQGGSTEDALKNAFIAGASGAAFSGARGTLAADLSSPMARFDQTVTGFGNTITGEGFTGQTVGGENTLFSNYRPDATKIAENPFDSTINKRQVVSKGTLKKEPTMFDKMSDYAFRGGDSVGDVATRQSLAKTDAIQKSLASSKASGLNVNSAAVQKAALSAGDAAFKAAGTSTIAKYGPSLALATAAGAAGGIFDTPEEEEIDTVRTGMDVYEENPDIYNVANLEPLYIEGDPTVGTKYPYYKPQAVAEGGEIFPRRVGGIMPDEGIPNKDSVRAMLMPGEFVMTTDAVKGLGGGDMNKGINNMYGVMRNLEQRGKAMA